MFQPLVLSAQSLVSIAEFFPFDRDYSLMGKQRRIKESY